MGRKYNFVGAAAALWKVRERKWAVMSASAQRAYELRCTFIRAIALRCNGTRRLLLGCAILT
jgi:hypothetical protein